MEQRRNAEARLLHHHPLQAVSGAHAGFASTIWVPSGRVICPTPSFNRSPARLLAHAGEFVAEIAALAVVTVFIEDQPVRVHLGELLFRGHTRQ
jgi:hypothetical protein